MINILYLHAGAEMYGADKVLLDLLDGLDKSVFNPIVILPCDGPLVEELSSRNISVSIMTYPILRRKYFNLHGAVNYLAELRKYIKSLKKIISEKSIDIIHSNTTAVTEGFFLSKKTGIPHLWHVHEIIQSPRFINRILCAMLSRTTSVVVVSNAVKRHIAETGRIGANSIKVIYNSVDNARYCPKTKNDILRSELLIPDNAQVVGMVGRINSWKGQTDFLSAAKLLLEKYDDAYFVLVGGTFEGEEWRKESIQNEILKTKYSDRIKLCDYHNDIEKFYSIFDVFVLPSTRPDPLPTVVLEAMSSGIPIVGYRHGGICEMVQDGKTGLLANICDVQDLSIKIGSLLDDRERREKMGNASRNRVIELFSRQAYITQFSEIYIKISQQAR